MAGEQQHPEYRVGGKGSSEEGRVAGTGHGDSPHSHCGDGVRGQGSLCPCRVSTHRAGQAAKSNPGRQSRAGQEGQH